jgi:hypothetical protein
MYEISTNGKLVNGTESRPESGLPPLANSALPFWDTTMM